MAWNVHYINTFVARRTEELPSIEAINRVVFDGVKSQVRVPWSNPALSKYGLAVFWDNGFRVDEKRKLVHARDNNGYELLEDSGVYRS
jgi:hypothetical protein